VSDDLYKCAGVCGQAPTQDTQGQQGVGGRKRVPTRRYTRTVGYYAAYDDMNVGKQREVQERKMYEVPDAVRRQVAADSLAVS